MNVRIASRRLAASLLLVLPGCSGPTHTAGTKSLAAGDRAVLSVPQLPKEAHVQIHTVRFDNAGDEHKIGKSHDFYLTPGAHTASLTFAAVLPKVGGLAGWLIPKGDMVLPGPSNVPLGAFTAGKSYELALPTQTSLDNLLQTGQLSLVREKARP